MAEAMFEGTEGRIVYRRWEPAGAPQHIVQIVHGYGEHRGRYGHVAEALAGDGAVVDADDHIGHGRSDGKRDIIGDFDHVVKDLLSLAGIAHGDYPDFPLVLVGHSMGGLLPARYAERWPDDGGRHEVVGDLATWIRRVA